MRGTGRRFWTLVALAMATEALVVVAATRMLNTVLPCWWAPARPPGWLPGAVCEKPMLFIGYRSWLPMVMVAGVVLASVVLMVVTASTQMLKTRRAWAGLRRAGIEAPVELLAAAGSAGLLRRRIVTVDTPEAFSFCRGLVFAQVVVSSGLVSALDVDQLSAVLVHEAAHARRRDPLRGLVARSVAAGLFFLPTLGDLALATVVDSELGADASAVRAVGRRPLVEALIIVLRAQRPVLGLVAEMAGVESLDLRIATLRNGKLPAIRLRPRLLVATAVVAAVLSFVVVWLPRSSAHTVGGTGVQLTPGTNAGRPMPGPPARVSGG